MAGLVPAIGVSRLRRPQRIAGRSDGRRRCLHWRALQTCAATAGLCVVATAALTQSYPSQPVRFIVPYAAGGGTDAMARFFSKGLEQRLGQPFVVENRGGSGTTIGANF